MDFQMFMDKVFHSGELTKVVKFGITGVINTLVDYGVFILLTEVLGINIYFSQVCSYAAGTLNSYLINRKWTFRTKNRFFSLQIVKFIFSNLAVLGISMLLLKLFVDVIGCPVMLAKLISICITTVINFLFGRLWVFR